MAWFLGQAPVSRFCCRVLKRSGTLSGQNSCRGRKTPRAGLAGHREMAAEAAEADTGHLRRAPTKLPGSSPWLGWAVRGLRERGPQREGSAHVIQRGKVESESGLEPLSTGSTGCSSNQAIHSPWPRAGAAGRESRHLLKLGCVCACPMSWSDWLLPAGCSHTAQSPVLASCRRGPVSLHSIFTLCNSGREHSPTPFCPNVG